MKNILLDILKDKDLSEINVAAFMEALCDDDVSAEQKSFAMGAIMSKEVTGAFLAEVATYLLDRATVLDLSCADAIDVCGTGGDGTPHQPKTFNISTATAFILAAGGVPVIKHGNKAISSQSGSSDVLEALGVSLSTTPESAQTCFDQNNLCFVSAPHFHPVLKTVAPLRQAIGIPTFFNFLGPLINPARVRRQLIGVYDANSASKIMEAAKGLGKTDVMVVHSQDGLDEISLSAPTNILHLTGGEVFSSILDPKNLNVTMASLQEVSGSSAQENAKIIERIFAGEKGAASDIVCLNAAAGFVVAGKDNEFEQGLARAREIIEKGDALLKLQSMREKS